MINVSFNLRPRSVTRTWGTLLSVERHTFNFRWRLLTLVVVFGIFSLLQVSRNIFTIFNAFLGEYGSSIISFRAHPCIAHPAILLIRTNSYSVPPREGNEPTLRLFLNLSETYYVHMYCNLYMKFHDIQGYNASVEIMLLVLLPTGIKTMH